MAQCIFLIRNIIPDQYGGAETYQLKLAKILQSEGYNPIILSSSKKLLTDSKKQNIQSIKAPYLKNQNWSSWRNLLLPVYFIWQCRLYFWYKKIFREYQPTAVNIQSRDDWIAVTLAAKKLNIRNICWTDHIDFRTWVFQNVRQKFKNPIGKYILKLSKIPKKIIMISDFEYNFACKNIFLTKPKNLIVVKNGAIDEKEQFQNIQPEFQSFCYVGRLVNYKGIQELITAFKNVSPNFPDAKLFIYGDGNKNDISFYKDLAKGQRNIHFCGYTNNPLQAIAQAETFILPSYYEGMSLSLLDALMMQKTIITTKIDGNSEIIDDQSGILIKPKSTEDLSKAITTVLQDSNKSKQLARNGRQKFEQEFNFLNTVKQKLIPIFFD